MAIVPRSLLSDDLGNFLTSPRVSVEVHDLEALIREVIETLVPDSTSRSQGGLGLGLAIVRYLVELHGGTVQAASPGAGQGATP